LVGGLIFISVGFLTHFFVLGKEINNKIQFECLTEGGFCDTVDAIF